MELTDIMKHRRSVRVYTGEPVSEDKLNMILKAGLLSASSRNRKPWELYATTDPEMLIKLSGCREGAAQMLKNAGAAVCVFGNSEKSDVWVEDCSIVLTNMHLMADHIGLGSCWIQGRLRNASDGRSTDAYVKEVMNVPEDLELLAILSVGVPAIEKQPAPHTDAELALEKIHIC